jgi:hypothetical protein
MQTGIAVRTCPECAETLSVGDPVSVVASIIRRPNASRISLGTSGTVQAIASSSDGHLIFRVKLDSGSTTQFLRGEIHRQRDGG